MKKTFAFVLLLAAATIALAQDTAIFQQAGSPVIDAIASGIKSSHSSEGLGAPAGPFKVSAAAGQGAKDIQTMAPGTVKYAYAVGSGPANLASQVLAYSGVYTYVPNPEGSGLTTRARWAGVSPYADPSLVLRYLKGAFNLNRVALLYTKQNNQAVAKVFEASAAGEKLAVSLVGVGGPDEIQKVLEPALKQSDAVLLLIDPITFSQEATRYIVTTCIEKKKMMVGFTDQVASVGVAVAIYPPPEAIASTAVAAMKSLRDKGEDKKVLFPSKFVLSVNENALKTLGVKAEEGRVAKKY